MLRYTNFYYYEEVFIYFYVCFIVGIWIDWL